MTPPYNFDNINVAPQMSGAAFLLLTDLIRKRKTFLKNLKKVVDNDLKK